LKPQLAARTYDVTERLSASSVRRPH